MNIRNSTSIKYVMINGRIFDAATMAQAGNHPAPAPRAFWKEGQITGAQATMDAHEKTEGPPETPPNQ